MVTTLAVVNVKPNLHPLKSSRVIISLLGGLTMILVFVVIISCFVCSSKKSSKSISRQRLLAIRNKNPTKAYDTVAKYYQDGHLSLNLESTTLGQAGGTDLREEDENQTSVSHKRSGSIRAPFTRKSSKPTKLPKKLSRATKFRSTSHKQAARSISHVSVKRSESNVLYENLPRTGSMSSLYSSMSTESASSAPWMNESSFPGLGAMGLRLLVQKAKTSTMMNRFWSIPT